MLVYGNPTWTEDPRAKLARLAEALQRLAGMPAGIERHSVLVAVFIEAGELVPIGYVQDGRSLGQSRSSTGRPSSAVPIELLAVRGIIEYASVRFTKGECGFRAVLNRSATSAAK